VDCFRLVKADKLCNVRKFAVSLDKSIAFIQCDVVSGDVVTTPYAFSDKEV